VTPPRTLVFGSTNAGKVGELRALLGQRWVVKTAADFPHLPDVEEDRDTFEGNAAKKAHAFASALGLWALADDSGLCVDALQGRPGVHSARYGPDAAARNARLLGELQGVPEALRTARFECALCLAGPGGEEQLTRGTCEGRIGWSPLGSNGFGYDPIFVFADGRTLAELSGEEKSQVSHRGAAFRAMLPHLERLLGA
jgi:XTP/dITP diphosphohydrolase